ncbi:MAG TPA: thrombospondin type 3 repeat-containing protein [Pyrinomonadaceae bacterium]|jgi:hypothetical protein|nr:thrombospondin type 3 repeat-containing protein [Pyrinomonadaceae bacterium]
MNARHISRLLLALGFAAGLCALLFASQSAPPSVVADTSNPSAASAAPPAGDRERDDCIREAQRRAEQLVRAGRRQDEVERAFQTALAGCNGQPVSPAEASFIGATNVDYFRLARLVVAHQLTPAAYLARMRDRARKVRRARRDRQWLEEFARGDDDGDLVPNERDRCPRTPELTATDDTGCPTNERLPAAPSDRELQRVLGAMHVAISPACAQASMPTTPNLLRITERRALKFESLLIDFTVQKVKGQPSGCTVFYEFEYDLAGRNCSNEAETAHGFVIMQTADIVSTDQTTPTQEVLRLVRSAPSTIGAADDRQFFATRGHCYDSWHWRVRAINANGLSSFWSDWIRMQPVVGQPG